jgi:hypothetical protein
MPNSACARSSAAELAVARARSARAIGACARTRPSTLGAIARIGRALSNAIATSAPSAACTSSRRSGVKRPAPVDHPIGT